MVRQACTFLFPARPEVAVRVPSLVSLRRLAGRQREDVCDCLAPAHLPLLPLFPRHTTRAITTTLIRFCCVRHLLSHAPRIAAGLCVCVSVLLRMFEQVR